MPRNPDFEQINLVLTKRQHEALLQFVETYDGGISDAIRDALSKLVPDFPDDMPRRGKYKRTIEEGKTKACRYCGVEKPLSAFSRNPQTDDGHSHICHDCASVGRTVPPQVSVFARASCHNTRAKYLNVKGRITRQQLKALMTQQNGRCAYCNTDIANDFEVDHVIPLSRGGTNEISNIALACKKCNRAKGTQPKARLKFGA